MVALGIFSSNTILIKLLMASHKKLRRIDTYWTKRGVLQFRLDLELSLIPLEIR
jgi:hypothetical protein